MFSRIYIGEQKTVALGNEWARGSLFWKTCPSRDRVPHRPFLDSAHVFAAAALSSLLGNNMERDSHSLLAQDSYEGRDCQILYTWGVRRAVAAAGAVSHPMWTPPGRVVLP